MSRQVPRSVIFARRVRQFREQRGWSQGELARRLAAAGHPIGQSRVSAIEAPGAEPRTVGLDQAQAFADALGVSFEQLVLEDGSATRGGIVGELMSVVELAETTALDAVERTKALRAQADRFLERGK